jgi:adenylate cyclase
LRGAEAFFLHFSRRTKDSLYEARRLLEQSLAIDPGYARAAAALSETHLYAYAEPYDGDYLSPAALDRALELAETAVRLDARLPQARALLGMILNVKGQHDAAIAKYQQAFALNPNFIDHRYTHLPLNHLATGATLILDDIPVAMLFAVFEASVEAQEHDANHGPLKSLH